MDSRPLLETLGSTSQVAEKGLRKPEAYLKRFLKLGCVEKYAWIEGKEIIADVLTNTGSKRAEINEVMLEGCFRNALDERNCARYKNRETKIEGLATKMK